MTDRLSDPALASQLDYRNRGFEHIVDIFRDNKYHHDLGRRAEAHDNLGSRIKAFEDHGISNHQQDLVALRVGEEHAPHIVMKLQELAVQSLIRRFTEESHSLRGAEIKADLNDQLFMKYLELAGNIDRLGEFIAWLDEMSLRGMGMIVHHKHDVGKLPINWADRAKGLSFELAGCFELGDPTYHQGVQRVVDAIPDQLADIGYNFQEPVVDPRFTVEVTPTSEGESPTALVVIDRPVVDVKKESTDNESVVHVTERINRLVVLPLLPRKLIKAIARLTPGEATNSSQQVYEMMLGRYAMTDAAAVVPVSSVLYMRSARKPDEAAIEARLLQLDI